METHGPLGTLWVSFGLIAFYMALIWLNTALALFLTPLIAGVPVTWFIDWRKRRRGELAETERPESSYQG